MIFMVGFLFAGETPRIIEKTVTLSASAGTDTEQSGGVHISDWNGTVVLAVDPVLDSGTAQDIVVTFQHKFNGLDFNGTDLAVGTVAAASVTAGTTVYFDITALSDFIYADVYDFKFVGASGTYGATLTVQIKGQ